MDAKRMKEMLFRSVMVIVIALVLVSLLAKRLFHPR
jgi:hypothetical protein